MQIKFITEHCSSGGDAGYRKVLRGESDGKYAHRRYRVSGLFQEMSMRRARRLVIKEIEMQTEHESK